MKGGIRRAPKIIPVVVGKIFLRWIFTKADLLFFIHRIFWYVFNARLSMNSSVDFFESLIDEDGRFAELNCQEPPQRGQRRQTNTVQRARPLIQGVYSNTLQYCFC
ncbi:unnamed protein product [Euphydryas editha]|uniref:Uncharacterized protein n=1 Tax=Euphydryas editha TaxID=104508 RepID=A0AAU9U5I7_EUPED|nr:unnamed protein product [Euphydryas editha]